MVGMFNEMTYFNGVAESVPEMLKNIDKWGGPETFPHMAAGWAVAGNTPFMWTKQVAANFGGTRNPLVISWPARIKAKGEIRSQFHHVVDIAPTVLEAATARAEDRERRGAEAMAGVSMVYTSTIRGGTAPDAVLEIGNRAGRATPGRRHCTRPRGKRAPAQLVDETGGCTTWTMTQARPPTSRRSIPTAEGDAGALRDGS
jgi:hypothetical protein